MSIELESIPAELFGGGALVHLATLRRRRLAVEPPALDDRRRRPGRVLHAGREREGAPHRPRPARRALGHRQARPVPERVAARPRRAHDRGRRRARDHRPHLPRLHRPAVPDAERHRLRRRRRGAGIGATYRSKTTSERGAPPARALSSTRAGGAAIVLSPCLVVEERDRGRYPSIEVPRAKSSRSLDRGNTKTSVRYGNGNGSRQPVHERADRTSSSSRSTARQRRDERRRRDAVDEVVGRERLLPAERSRSVACPKSGDRSSGARHVAGRSGRARLPRPRRSSSSTPSCSGSSRSRMFQTSTRRRRAAARGGSRQRRARGRTSGTPARP